MTKMIKLTEVANSQLGNTKSAIYVATQYIVTLGQGTIQASKTRPQCHVTQVALANNQTIYVEESVEDILKEIK